MRGAACSACPALLTLPAFVLSAVKHILEFVCSSLLHSFKHVLISISGQSNRVEPSLAKSIEDWLKRWKLKASWCRVSAYFTLEVWAENNATHYRNCLFHPAPYKRLTRREPPLGLPRYYVEDGRNYYVEHLTEHLKRILLEEFPPAALATVSQRNVFIKHIVDQTKKKYCKPAEELQPIVRSTERREIDKHLEWAVRVHVKGEKQAAVVRELQRKGCKRGLTAAAVSLAIKSVLRQLHLVL